MYEASRVLLLTTLLLATGIAQRVNKRKLHRSDIH